MAKNGRWSFVYLIAVVAGFLAFSLLLHMPHDLEHWSSDFVTSQWSKRAASQHSKIVLVYISESTLANLPYLSPTDRGILARLIQAVDRSEVGIAVLASACLKKSGCIASNYR